jgi:hypothetical protein
VLATSKDHAAVPKARALEELALGALQGGRFAIGIRSIGGGGTGLLAAARAARAVELMVARIVVIRVVHLVLIFDGDSWHNVEGRKDRHWSL